MDDENKDNILSRLKEYLLTKYNIPLERTDWNASLLYDFEFRGDDVDDFFASLIKEFNVNVEVLDLSRFNVGDEPLDFLSPIVRFFKRDKIKGKPTVRVSDIVRFIETGVLQ